HTAPASDVDARLDGDRHTWLQLLLLGGMLAQARVFVDLQPQPVAGAVQELLAVAGGLQHLTRRRVRRLARHARRELRFAGLLRAQHRIVDGLRLGAWLAQADRARHIGAVAVVARA